MTQTVNPFLPLAELIADLVVERLKGISAPPGRVRLKQAATIAGVSPNSLRGAIALGELPASKQGRWILVDMKDLAKWMEASKIKA